MILTKLNFPKIIFFIGLALLFYSCQNLNEEKNNPNSIEYYDLLTKAEKKNSANQYDSAFYFYNKAKLLCNANDWKKKVYALNEMAAIQLKNNDFNGCEATSIEALKICTDTIYLTRIHNTLALALQSQLDYKNTLKEYQQSLKFVKTPLDQLIIKNNIAYLSIEKEDYKQAIKLYVALVNNPILKSSKKDFARILDNLGFAHLKNNQSKIAFPYLEKSMQIRDSLNDNFAAISSCIHLSEYYQKLHPKIAENFAQKAYRYATDSNCPDDRIEALKFLINTSAPFQAKQLALKQIRLSDSLYKVRQTAKNQFAKIKYDSELIEKESHKQKKAKEIFILLLLTVIFIGFILYFYIKKINRKKVKQSVYETETRIAKKLHDELANDVFNAMTYADSQNLEDAGKKEFLIENLDKIYNQARNISKENSQIDTGENFSFLLKDMLSSFNSEKVNVIIKESTVDWSKIKKESKIVVYRTLQELMVNMKKHSECNLLVINMEGKINHLEINYSDNGKGCSNISKLKKGLQNVENRIFLIKGTITFESETNKGFKSKIKIPK